MKVLLTLLFVTFAASAAQEPPTHPMNDRWGRVRFLLASNQGWTSPRRIA